MFVNGKCGDTLKHDPPRIDVAISSGVGGGGRNSSDGPFSAHLDTIDIGGGGDILGRRFGLGGGGLRSTVGGGGGLSDGRSAGQTGFKVPGESRRRSALRASCAA